jgi:ribonuclease Z
VVSIAGETLKVHFLGTAGALPTPYKNPSCITIDAIFITHWHADHFLGLFGLVQTLSFMGREEPLPIFGPRGVHEIAQTVQQVAKFNLKFAVHSYELTGGAQVPFNGYHVRAFETQHGIPSLGYILTEDDRPGRFDRERAIELGIRPGPLFGRLQKGEEVSIEKEGTRVTIHPSDVMGTPRPGRRVVYTGDTRPDCSSWKEWALNADCLIHDATFDSTEEARAREVFHSTAGEAGMIASEIHAGTLALVHISSRYTSMKNHIADAQQHFEGEVIAPTDLTMIELPYRDI